MLPPKPAMLRYPTRISSFVYSFSRLMASFASLSLRSRVLSWQSSIPARSASMSPPESTIASWMQTFLMYCCVRVEAPCRLSLVALLTAARMMPCASTPLCS